MQTTYYILNNTVAGSGAVQVEYFKHNRDEHTKTPQIDVSQEKAILETNVEQDQTEFVVVVQIIVF